MVEVPIAATKKILSSFVVNEDNIYLINPLSLSNKSVPSLGFSILLIMLIVSVALFSFIPSSKQIILHKYLVFDVVERKVIS